MSRALRSVAVCALGAVALSGCATKGQLRRGLAEQSAALRAELQAEQQARIAADQQMQANIQDLQRELQTLRTEFGAQITMLEEGMQFALPVHFEFDDATIRETDRPALDRFVQVAERFYPESSITVEGFADPAGSARYNEALSQRRADAVRGYVVERGLPDPQVRAVGYGEARQVVAGAAGSDSGAELNRRVVFVIESPSLPRTTTTPTDDADAAQATDAAGTAQVATAGKS